MAGLVQGSMHSEGAEALVGVAVDGSPMEAVAVTDLPLGPVADLVQEPRCSLVAQAVMGVEWDHFLPKMLVAVAVVGH